MYRDRKEITHVKIGEETHSPYQKCPILTLPLSTRLLSKPKLLPLFVMNDKRASH